LLASTLDPGGFLYGLRACLRNVSERLWRVVGKPDGAPSTHRFSLKTGLVDGALLGRAGSSGLPSGGVRACVRLRFSLHRSGLTGNASSDDLAAWHEGPGVPGFVSGWPLIGSSLGFGWGGVSRGVL